MRIGLFNTAFVGDLVLMSRLIDALSNAGHEVVLFSNPAGCALYSFDSRVKKSVVVRKQSGIKKIFAIAQIARQIRTEHLDVLILAHRSLTSRLIALASGQMRKMTFGDDVLVKILFETAKSSIVTHESERYLSLAASLVTPELQESSRMVLSGDRSFKKFLTSFPNFFDPPNPPYFVCAPGSAWPTKKYPSHLLARVIGRILLERQHLRCVLSGGPSDSQDISEVLNEIQQHPSFSVVLDRVVDARTCLPLPELVELSRGAQFVLTPDSAPLHIGSATETKTFAFFGPTPSNTGFGPLARGSKILDYQTLRGAVLPCQPCSKHGTRVCPLSHHSCLADLSPDAVAVLVLESVPVG